MTPLSFQRRFHRSIRAQGMRTSCLAETPQQDSVRGFQEDDLRRDHAADGFQNLRQLAQLAAFANINYEGGAARVTRPNSQFCKTRDQFDWQVVNAVVAEIFESLQD